MKTLRNKPPASTEQRTGAQTLKLLLADEISAKTPKDARIILYLCDGMKGAERNWTKYPNEIHEVMRDALDRASDGVLYIYMWRCSWGYGRNYCRLSQKQVVDETVIDSTRTAKRAFDTLVEKQFIVRAMTEDERIDTTKQGTLYRVMTPDEIVKQMTLEAVDFVDIPPDGVVMSKKTPDKIKGVNLSGVDIDKREPSYNKEYNDTSEIGSGKNDKSNFDRSNSGSGKNDRGDPDKNTPDKINGDAANADNDRNQRDPRKNDRGKNGPPFKEDKEKDSLLEDPVKLFYTGIGQKRVIKVKREKGDSVLQELRKEGFSPEDIQFAIEWTLKPENTKEKVYDFSIISHTILQALSAREAGQQAADAARKEAAGVRAAEEERRRLEGEIQDLRSGLTETELADLRKRAEKEIAQTDGIKKEFINEPLIVAKENEILRSKM